MLVLCIMEDCVTKAQPYKAPTLRVFGAVVELTANGSKSGRENSGNTFGNNSCGGSRC